MKKYFLILQNCIFLTSISFSQAPAIEWQVDIGTTASEQIGGFHPTSDGGYILGGHTIAGISGDKTEPGLGELDYWVLKLNSTGGIVWQNTVGGSDYDYLYAVEPTSDGGCIMGGGSMSGISGDKSEACLGSYDYWVVKLNAAGVIMWQNTIGGSNYDILYDLKQTIDGGYILCGNSKSGISGDKTEALWGGGSYSDCWIIKLNSSGNIEWQNSIGGLKEDNVLSIEQTTDGGYILGASSDSEISGDKTEASKGLSDYWVVKLNNSGSIEWQNTIGGSLYENLWSINQTLDEGYILAGYTKSGISGDKTENIWPGGLSGYDFWVVKLNSAGELEWQNNIGGTADDVYPSITQNSDGTYYLGGKSYSAISGDKTDPNNGLVTTCDYWILKLDAMGNIVWQNSIGGSGNDVMWWAKIDLALDGGCLVGGDSYSNITGDKTADTKGGLDFWIFKLFPECSPSIELCNTLDDNCNGLIDDGITETISISAAGTTTFCQGGSVLLNAIYSGATIQWKKDGVNIPGATSSAYNVTKKATYTATTTSACGTATSTGIYVNVQKNPTASITAGGATTFCAGGSVILTANSGAGLSYQWYKGASLIAGATLINYSATTAGNYKCRVTKTATGCFKNSNVIAVTVPCKEGEELINHNENSFSIYPNPNNGTFNLISESSFGATSPLEGRVRGVTSINIYNPLGQLIYSKQINSHDGNINETISINDLSSGVYFLRLHQNNIIYKQKLIIEK